MSQSGSHETSPFPAEPRSLEERLRWLRKQMGLTQVELARALGCEQAMVSSWEVGRTRPGAVTLGALAKHYGVSTQALGSGEGFPEEAGRSLRALRAAERTQGDPEAVLALRLDASGEPLQLVDTVDGTRLPADAAQAIAELLKALKKGRRAWVVLQ
jgi:transcriptional regulator with XRE-family HTH domain